MAPYNHFGQTRVLSQDTMTPWISCCGISDTCTSTSATSSASRHWWRPRYRAEHAVPNYCSSPVIIDHSFYLSVLPSPACTDGRPKFRCDTESTDRSGGWQTAVQCHVPVKWLVIIGHVNRSFYLLTYLHRKSVKYVQLKVMGMA